MVKKAKEERRKAQRGIESRLGAETVEGSSLPLESVDDVEGGDGLPLGVLSVGDRVADDRLKEELEDTTGLVVDQARDTLDTTSSCETADSGLGDTLDVVTKDLVEWKSGGVWCCVSTCARSGDAACVLCAHLPVALGSTLAETLAAFSSSSHCCISCWWGWCLVVPKQVVFCVWSGVVKG
jgi:hypothetical protein